MGFEAADHTHRGDRFWATLQGGTYVPCKSLIQSCKNPGVFLLGFKNLRIFWSWAEKILEIEGGGVIRFKPSRISTSQNGPKKFSPAAGWKTLVKKGPKNFSPAARWKTLVKKGPKNFFACGGLENPPRAGIGRGGGLFG